MYLMFVFCIPSIWGFKLRSLVQLELNFFVQSEVYGSNFTLLWVNIQLGQNLFLSVDIFDRFIQKFCGNDCGMCVLVSFYSPLVSLLILSQYLALFTLKECLRSGNVMFSAVIFLLRYASSISSFCVCVCVLIILHGFLLELYHWS